VKIALIGLAVIACATLVATADDPPDTEFGRAVLGLVRSHSAGHETCEVNDRRTTIAFDAMTYLIHEPNRMGRLQRAQKELGPRARGLVIELDALPGPYGGPMECPQTLAGPYYDTHCNEFVEDGRHHFVRARFGHAFPDKLRGKILQRLGMGALWTPLRGRPVIPVTVVVEPERERYKVGESLLVRVLLRNGLSKPIRFKTFAKTPNAWNGETQCVQIPDIYRGGATQTCYLARPEVNCPDTISGIGSHAVPAGASLRLRIDLAKWRIRGGWTQRP